MVFNKLTNKYWFDQLIGFVVLFLFFLKIIVHNPCFGLSN